MSSDKFDFVEKYVEYASKSTDAPDIFHKFCAYSVLATVIGRNIFTQYGHQRLYPNIYMILIGSSTKMRKSTSLSIAMDLIGACDSNLILPSDFSQEGFYKDLETKGQGVICSMEFLSLMELMEKTYASSVKPFLTEIYDCPSVYIVKRAETETILKFPCINLISATTLDWFLERVKEGDLRSGFLARFLFITVSETKKRIAWPHPRDEHARNDLKNYLQLVRSKKNELIVSEQIKMKHKEIFDKFNDITDKHQQSNIYASLQRLDGYLLKFSMLRAVAKMRFDRIEEEDIVEANNIIVQLAKNLIIFAEEDLSLTEFSKSKNKVLKFIKGNNGCDTTTLLRSTHMPSRDLELLLKNLIEENRIKLTTDMQTGGRPKTRYYAIQ